MNAAETAATGRVVSLHLHTSEPGGVLKSLGEIELVEAKGIVGDTRYFGRLSRTSGLPSRRQVTLIEREQLEEHAKALKLQGINPGAARSNIETSGISLSTLLGTDVQIGTAVLHIHSFRDPCEKMDAICQGLKSLMMDGKQGVLAEVRVSGKVRIGDSISLLAPATAA